MPKYQCDDSQYGWPVFKCAVDHAVEVHHGATWVMRRINQSITRVQPISASRQAHEMAPNWEDELGDGKHHCGLASRDDEHGHAFGYSGRSPAANRARTNVVG